MIKQLIDLHFARFYNLGRVVTIDESHTMGHRFDLSGENDAMVVPFGEGYASFCNDTQSEIAILDYEGYIDKYAGTVFHTGRMKCDCVLESQIGATVILDEITSSNSGVDNLQKAITGKKSYPGGKFEKAESQLLESLRTLSAVPELASHFAKQSKKVCLCSYKLYASAEQSLIGNPVSVFSRGQSEADRLAGENGVKISSPQIEALGFEFRRISHTYAYCI